MTDRNDIECIRQHYSSIIHQIHGYVDQRRFLKDEQRWGRWGRKKPIERFIGLSDIDATMPRLVSAFLFFSVSAALLIKLGVDKVVFHFTVCGNLLFALFVTDEIPLGLLNDLYTSHVQALAFWETAIFVVPKELI